MESRISNLYWIRDEEALFDPMVSIGAGPPGNPTDLDSTLPLSVEGFPVSVDANPDTVASAEWTGLAQSISQSKLYLALFIQMKM